MSVVDEDGFVLFEDETKLEINVMYCVFCLLTDLKPRKAVTVTGGDACCGEHLFFAKSEQARFFASKFFEKLREQNIAELATDVSTVEELVNRVKSSGAVEDS